MSTMNKDRMLELLWKMDIDVSMYLCGELPRSTLIPRIIESCQEMREQAVDDFAEHQIVNLERVACECSGSPAAAHRRQRSYGPDDSQLMKGLFDLRAQLHKARRPMS